MAIVNDRVDWAEAAQRAEDRDERRTVALELACSGFVHLANALQKVAETVHREIEADAADRKGRRS